MQTLTIASLAVLIIGICESRPYDYPLASKNADPRLLETESRFGFEIPALTDDTENSSGPEWRPEDMPHPWLEPSKCGAKSPSWLCDPNGVLNSTQADIIRNYIESIKKEVKCACRSCPQPPNQNNYAGHYRIAVAVVPNVALNHGETDTPQNRFNALRKFGEALRLQYWRPGYCGDSIVISFSSNARQIFTSTGPVARQKIPNHCVNEVTDKVISKYFKNGQYAKGLYEMIGYYRNALLGGSCGTRSGLSVGAIIGIVLGCAAFVGMICGLVVCCIGFRLNWECIHATCLGICIGAIMGCIQGLINAIIISLCHAACEAMGCEDCGCECEPIDCMGDDYTGPDGGGGGGGGF